MCIRLFSWVAAFLAANAWAAPDVIPIWKFQGLTAFAQGLVRHDGKLYGVVSNGWGEVFELTPQADGSWSKSSYRIQPEADGRYLASTLTFDDHGMLYPPAPHAQQAPVSSSTPTRHHPPMIYRP